ncbi:type III-A CRISPR-associated protein Csm2 [Chloroflexus sp. Y-396-1]|uniref:type III-A CRISPR-associated protein Csm2 n=1 Tax=Chloroflexus sp. Y-396-1 TaxID=867845 RepID=UPI000490AFAC|nr:type III-A CRISPR-associated protein Csm2 [Chloroflexus sp. Y-396-1]
MNRQRGDQSPSVQPISADDLKKIMTEDSAEAVRLLIQKAEELGEELSKKLTTSQIRNIFGEVRSIEQEVGLEEKTLPLNVQRRLLMLKPKMAYQIGRFSNNGGLKALVDTLSQAIDLIGNDVRRFHTFVDLFEAILAYHRRYGGKTS